MATILDGKQPTFYFLLVLLMFLAGTTVSGKPASDDLQQKYQAFIKNPDSDTKSALSDAIGQNDAETALSPVVAKHNGLDALVLSGNPHAVNLAFELLPLADGALASQISLLLGATIVDHPEVFVRALESNKDGVVRLDSILGNTGPGYVDDLDGQIEVLEARYSAIRGVSGVPEAAKDLSLYELSKLIYESRKHTLDN